MNIYTEKEKEYNNFMLITKDRENKIKINSNSLQAFEKEKIRNEKEYENKVKEYDQYIFNLNILEEYQNKIKDKNKGDIHTENYKYKKMLEESICPHCGGGFIFNGNKIEKGELTKETKDLIENKIKENNNLLEIFTKIDKLNIKHLEKPILKELEYPTLLEIPPEITTSISLPIKPKAPQYQKELKKEDFKVPKLEMEEINGINEIDILKLNECISTLEILNKISLDSLLIYKNKEDIEKEILSLNNKERYLELENQIKILNENKGEDNIAFLLKEISEAKSNSILYNEISIQIKELENNIEEISIPSSKEILEKINKNKINISKYEVIIESGEKILELESIKTQINKINEDIREKSTKIDDIKLLKKIINEIEYSEMEIIIKNINDISNMLLENMFEDPINICLSTNKMLKTTNKLKNSVNIKINYKNHIFENINELSYGEQMRISLCLTLAINKLNNGNKIIMMDEIFSSLNSSIHEQILELLKTQFGDKYIINVCHNIVDGFHDEIKDIKT